MIVNSLYKLFIVLILSVLMISGKTQAHQKKEAITRIIFNHRTENIEVIHRFSLHDVEHSAKLLFGNKFDIMSSKQSQQQFNDYINTHFSIKNNLGLALYLTSVGFELDSRFFWIYQEIPLDEDIDGLTISYGALREIWKAQTNLVNIERNKKVRSLVFRSGDVEQSVAFD